MSKKETEPTKPPIEKALIVGVEIKSEPGILSMEDSMEELALLASTAGIDVIGSTYQKIEKPNPETLIGKGKVEEIKILAEEMAVDAILFDVELSPRHQRELEEDFGTKVKIIDRTALILDIFAQHASSREGILQVELAYYQYRLPRLTRAWTHLARQSGGGGGRTGSVGGVGLRGPGEKQLEIDRREINRLISNTKADLEKVRAHRERHRQQRKISKIPTVALVGYTNAGKSTLLNKLSNSEVYVADQLFATLDPTTRRVELPAGHTVLFTDTVGFIQKLPTELVAAFRATLEEITEADLLLVVVDVTHPNAYEQWQSVQETLADIGGETIPSITVLNKIDQLPDSVELALDDSEIGRAIPISAKTGQGIHEMLRVIEESLFESFIDLTVYLPYEKGHLISYFHENGFVKSTDSQERFIRIDGSMPARLQHYFKEYLNPPK